MKPLCAPLWPVPPATPETGEPPMPLHLQPNLNETGKRYFREFSPGDDFYEALIDTV